MSDEANPTPGRDERRLTLIVIPHGDLETRTIEISYRRLKALLFGAAVLALMVVVVVGMWFPILAQAGRVGGLERDLARLEAERARVAELARTLEQVEEQYERVRQLLGATGTAADSGALLPPLRRDTTIPAAQGGSGSDDMDLSFGSWPEPRHTPRIARPQPGRERQGPPRSAIRGPEERPGRRSAGLTS